MIQYQYNRQVEPPAPYVHASVSRGDGSGTSVVIPALVDSGADKTVIPLALVEDLDLPQAGTAQAAGLGNITTTVPVYVVRIGIHDLAPAILDVLAIAAEPYVILGRDVLNSYRITLDGPQSRCIIE